MPVHSYRQKGVGGPLRILHDPSEKITHDFFDRDELDAPRRGVDVLSGLLRKAAQAEVSDTFATLSAMHACAEPKRLSRPYRLAATPHSPPYLICSKPVISRLPSNTERFIESLR
jgi:hypothetical protein